MAHFEFTDRQKDSYFLASYILFKYIRHMQWFKTRAQDSGAFANTAYFEWIKE